MFNHFMPKLILHEKEGAISIEHTSEPTWAPTIADLVAPPRVKVDLSEVTDKAAAIRRLTRGGITVGTQVMHLRHACSSSKGFDAFYLYEDPQFGMDVFPADTDAIRLGAIETPCREFCDRVVATVRMQESTDDLMVGDGQSVISPEFAATLQWQSAFGHKPLVKFGQAGQFRAMFNGCIAKGTFVVRSIDCDMILAPSCVKGSDQSELHGGELLEFAFGITQFAQESSSTISYQVTELWPNAAHEEAAKFHKLIAADLTEKAKSAYSFALAYGSKEIRNESGKPTEVGLLGAAAKACEAIGNKDLLSMKFFNQTIASMQAGINRRACVSGGVSARSFYAICAEWMPDGIVAISSNSVSGRAMAFRNPVAEREGLIPVRIIKVDWVPAGCAAFNSKTMAMSGMDFDGDLINLVSVNAASWIKIWHDAALKINHVADHNLRASKAKVASRAEMLYIIGSTNIGEVANVCSDLALLESMGVNIDDRGAKMAEQLHNAVDAAKRASRVNIELVAEIRKWAKSMGLTPEDQAIRKHSNGSVKNWDFDPDGKYIRPWEDMRPETPIAKAFCNLGPLLPQVHFDELKNAHFINWVPTELGDGYTFATKAMNDFNHSLAHLSRNGESSSELIEAWASDWHQKLLTMPEAWLRQAASAMFNMTMDSPKSTGYAMWMALPEIIFKMIEENVKNAPARNRATVHGHIIGREFAQFGNGRHMVKLSAIKKGRLMVQVFKMDNGAIFHLSDTTPTIHRKLGAEFAVEVCQASEGRWGFILPGLTKQDAAVMS